MNRRFSKLILAGIILLSVICFWVLGHRKNITYATAVGTVRVGQTLKVRKGPGTKYACLKSGGQDVELDNRTQVTILAESKKWYKIRFTYKSQRKVGYVPMKYLSAMSGDMNTEISGRISPSPVLVRTRAVQSGSLLRVEDVAVRLPKAKRVRILSESVIYGVKYYRISFSYLGKQCAGYVPAKSVEADYISALPGIITASGQATLKQKAGSTATVQAEGGTIVMKNGTQVLMFGEETVSGVKYIAVDVVYNDKTYSGYVTANLIRFEQVEVEEVVKGEKENYNIVETTPEPQPTQTAASLGQEKPIAGKKGDNAQTANMTDQEFKKQMVAEGFPSSYISILQALHAKYPKWQFKAYQTGIDWNTAVDNESVVGLNLISNSRTSDWKSQEEGAYNKDTDTYIPFDGSSWVTASQKAVKYYMDPRNFLDENKIFQFESLEYQEGVQNQNGVENVLKNTPMYQASFDYLDDSGKETQITYSKAFMEAAVVSRVSPYHLASRVKQEVVTGPTSMSSSVSGTVKGYEGIYNFYNIGAYHSTKSGGAVANGLSWASKDTTYMRPWNTKYKAIVGGAQYLGSNYINVGQNTLYLQKFNMTSSNTYNHQYMANIEAPASEALKTAEAYGEDKANMSLVFSIPVYSAMPSKVCPMPDGADVSPNNYLQSLGVRGFHFKNPFRSGDDGSVVYRLTVARRVKSVRIEATPVSTAAQVTGTGNKKLKKGTKTFIVKVKAQNGSIRKYKVRIKRKKK